MEFMSEAEKQLSENLGKCRCCFRMLIGRAPGAVQITDEIRNQFLDLTQIELLESEIFADRICQLCASDLKVFCDLRQDLVEKQKALYELAGLEDLQFVSNPAPQSQICDEANDDTQDDQSDFDMNFETIEQDEDTVYIEEYTDEQMINEENEEMEEAQTQVIKIEKVGVKNDHLQEDGDGSTSFDFFEEVVAEESKDQKYYELLGDENMIISCDLCGIELSKNHLMQHVQLMHKTFSCSQCEKKFQSKISLRRHTIENHGAEKSMRSKKRHFCPLCTKDYDYRKQLDDHIRSFHDKERNSQCHICNKTFYHRDLKKHIEHVHGDKNISCETCGKKYTCVENLRLHMRYHLPPSFECSHFGCGKKFHQKVLWEHHEKKHAEVKPFICEVCNATFFSIRDQKRHYQRVHEKVTRKCFLCEMQFSRKDKYRQHLLKKHPELTETERESMLDQIRNMKWNESARFSVAFKLSKMQYQHFDSPLIESESGKKFTQYFTKKVLLIVGLITLVIVLLMSVGCNIYAMNRLSQPEMTTKAAEEEFKIPILPKEYKLNIQSKNGSTIECQREFFLFHQDNNYVCEVTGIVIKNDTKNITINGNPKINVLYIFNYEVYTIPKGIFLKFPSLKHLIVNGNHMQLLQYDTFDGAENLEVLRLSNNELTELDAKVFQKMKNLKTLDLNRNKISFVHPESFKGLVNLERLYLSDNSLDHFLPEVFFPLKKLVSLSLENNQIAMLSSNVFEKNLKVRSLGLSNNTFIRLDPEIFNNFENLTDLSISELRLTSIDLRRTKTIQTLVLRNTDIVNISLANFPKILVSHGTNLEFFEFFIDKTTADFKKIPNWGGMFFNRAIRFLFYFQKEIATQENVEMYDCAVRKHFYHPGIYSFTDGAEYVNVEYLARDE